MTGETRVNAAGQLEWHNKVSKTWRPAVYHDSIRADLIRQFNSLGTYRFPRAVGSLPIGVTCFHYASRNWGTQRENWPAVLQQYEARPTDFVAAKPDIWTTAWGEVILDLNSNAILAFPELPATISSKIEGEFLIAFHRLNHHITMPDVRARMLRNPKTDGAILQGTTDPLRVGNLSMRMTRCREKCGMISWTKRAGSDTIKAFMDRILPQACRDANSIAGFRDLHQHEIAQMHLPLAGQHPERTRRQKDLSEAKKQRVYNEQLERCRQLKRKFDESEAGKQEAQAIKHEEDDTLSDESNHDGTIRRQRRIEVPRAPRRATTTPSQLSEFALRKNSNASNIQTQTGENSTLYYTLPTAHNPIPWGNFNTAQTNASNTSNGFVSTMPSPTRHIDENPDLRFTTSDPTLASQGVRSLEETQGRTPQTHNAYQNPISPYYSYTGNGYTGTSYPTPIGPYGTQPFPSVNGDGRQTMPQSYERPAPNQATMQSYQEQLSRLMAIEGGQTPRPLESVQGVRRRRRDSTGGNARVIRETGGEGQEGVWRRRQSEHNAPQQERRRQTLDVPTLSPYNAFESEQIPRPLESAQMVKRTRREDTSGRGQIPRQMESVEYRRQRENASGIRETGVEAQGPIHWRAQREGSTQRSATVQEGLENIGRIIRRSGRPTPQQPEPLAFPASYPPSEVEPSETFPWDAQSPPRLLSPFAPSATTAHPSSRPPTFPPGTVAPSRISTLPEPNYLDINALLPQPRPSQILRSSVVPPPQLRPQPPPPTAPASAPTPPPPAAQPQPASQEPSASTILSDHFASQEVFVLEGFGWQWFPSLGAWVSDAEIERAVADVEMGNIDWGNGGVTDAEIERLFADVDVRDIDWGALATDEIPEEWVDFDA